MNLSKLNKISQYLKFNAAISAIDIGLLGGQSRYTKFVILGRARTGSNFLRGMLNTHNHVMVFGELYRNEGVIDWSLPSYNSRSEELLRLVADEPVRLLKEKVFRSYPDSISAVGFKIFYYHAQSSKEQEVWDYLVNTKTHIIHIKRLNILKTYLSTQKAFTTGQWIDTKGDAQDSLTVTLDPEACLENFVNVKEQEQRFDNLFHNNPLLEVQYEKLCENPSEELERIQDFLGIRKQILMPTTYKQASKPMSEAISNYNQLKSYFNGTSWQFFFDE